MYISVGTVKRQGLWCHIDSTQLWGPQDGRGYAPVLIFPHDRDPEKSRVMSPY